MRKYNYEDINVGQEETFTTSLSAAQLEQFQLITGDYNPLHIDADFAKAHGHADRVVYGMLTVSFLSTVAGMYLPGERSLIYDVAVSFVKPLLLCNADTLTVVAKVVRKHDEFKLIQLDVRITDTLGDEVVRGKMKVGLSV